MRIWSDTGHCQSRDYCLSCLTDQAFRDRAPDTKFPDLGTCPHGVTLEHAKRLDADRRLDAEEAAFMRGDVDECPGCGCAKKRNVILSTFDRVVVINLDRRADRLADFHQGLTEWPFKKPERFPAVDGSKTGTPAWWTQGGGAWGCFKSHYNAIEQALCDGVESLLLLEDDAVLLPDFKQRVHTFIQALPDDWGGLYLGGQHLEQGANPPTKVNEHVVCCKNVNRTHAWALRGSFMKAVYRHLSQFSEWADKPRSHIDHWLGQLVRKGEHKVYAPAQWLIGQREGKSDVCAKMLPERTWNPHRVHEFAADNLPFVAVLGLHRSGSSCMAGMLHKLGVSMGHKLGGYEKKGGGGFEGVGLARLCEAVYTFPSRERKQTHEQVVKALRGFAKYNSTRGFRSATGTRNPIGGKYPHLCAMGPELIEAFGARLRVVHIDRPLADSIASLQARCPNRRDEVAELQRWLDHKKRAFLEQVTHFPVTYAALLANPEAIVDQLIAFLSLNPTPAQRQAAIEHVKPELCHHG